jgi:hypothetical protein
MENLTSEMQGFKRPAQNVAPVQEEVVGSEPAKKKRRKKHEEDKPLTYTERLKLLEIKPEEAIRIIDEMVENDYYKEEIKVSKSKSATISTRDVRFSDYLTSKLDEIDPTQIGMFNQLSSKYQLAASLVTYGDEKLPDLKSDMADNVWEDTLKIRLNFVTALPGPIFLALTGKLAHFDLKMNTILSEGYEANF